MYKFNEGRRNKPTELHPSDPQQKEQKHTLEKKTQKQTAH
jgi:hypothetical protein